MMWKKFINGCGAVLFCVAYNALFALTIVLSVFVLAGAAIVLTALGVPRESAADVFSVAPLLIFFLFWFFYLRRAHIDPFGDGGD